MKRSLPILLMVVIVGAIALMIIGASSPNNHRTLDTRLGVGKVSKIPYAHYVAFNGLASLFPRAEIIQTSLDKNYLDSLSNFSTGNALVIITNQFNPTEKELSTLMTFASFGNTIFLSARSISYQVEKTLSVTLDDRLMPFDDSFTVNLPGAYFQTDQQFSYPGYDFYSPIHTWNDSLVDIMATDKPGNPILFRYHVGGGNIYFHTAPLSLSNYFLLHKKNIAYYEQLFSLIPASVQRVYWDGYFTNKENRPPQPDKDQANWWTVMMRYPSMKAALWVGILTLLVYVLLEMRRKKKPVPILTPPKNDSLDFVRTIGRLYHERGDHRNLCVKMGSYFLEHVRNRYRVTTTKLDDELVKALHFKSGYPESELRDILGFISHLEKGPSISEAQLENFYNRLDKFYKHT